MRKESALLETKASKALALLWAGLYGVETLAEEEGLSLSEITYLSKIETVIVEYPEEAAERGLVFYSSKVSSARRETVEALGREIEIRIEPGFGELDVERLYRRAPRLVSLDSRLIRERARITTLQGTEYMVMYLTLGRLALFEGEAYYVRLPFVPSVANVHTHPEGACGLSRADIESTLDLLVSGGLFGAAATETCLAYMLRVGPVIEDDFIVVREAIVRRRVNELPGKSMKSIVFGFLSY